MKEILSKCPVCKVKYWNRAIRIHVISSAYSEAKKAMVDMLKFSRNKPYKFSPMVVRRNAPHLNYALKNKLI